MEADAYNQVLHLQGEYYQVLVLHLQEGYGRCQPWGQGCFAEGYIASI
jgi:hypothetical protein